FVVEAQQVRTGDGVGRDDDGEFAFVFAGFDGDSAAAYPRLHRPALERAGGGDFDRRTALGASRKEGGNGRRGGKRRRTNHRGTETQRRQEDHSSCLLCVSVPLWSVFLHPINSRIGVGLLTRCTGRPLA